jgi:predicted enzyme related to lactoylglutathione lyase
MRRPLLVGIDVQEICRQPAAMLPQQRGPSQSAETRYLYMDADCVLVKDVAQSATLTPMDLLINVDVPNLAEGVDFYGRAFGLTVSRRLGDEAVELSGLPVRLYLLQKADGSIGAGGDRRRYDRHWTPVHIDLVVDDIEAALARALAAGARAETEIRIDAWGKIIVLSDPFGNGFCLIQFLGRGYDEIAHPDPRR